MNDRRKAPYQKVKPFQPVMALDTIMGLSIMYNGFRLFSSGHQLEMTVKWLIRVIGILNLFIESGQLAQLT